MRFYESMNRTLVWRCGNKVNLLLTKSELEDCKSKECLGIFR